SSSPRGRRWQPGRRGCRWRRRCPPEGNGSRRVDASGAPPGGGGAASRRSAAAPAVQESPDVVEAADIPLHHHAQRRPVLHPGAGLRATLAILLRHYPYVDSTVHRWMSSRLQEPPPPPRPRPHEQLALVQAVLPVRPELDRRGDEAEARPRRRPRDRPPAVAAAKLSPARDEGGAARERGGVLGGEGRKVGRPRPGGPVRVRLG